MAHRSRFKPLTVPIDLSDPEHIQCPYHLYRRLHDAGAVGLDPDIGVAVVGYQALVALSKDTGLFSSSITQDGQGPRHMGVGADPIPEDVEEIFTRAHPILKTNLAGCQLAGLKVSIGRPSSHIEVMSPASFQSEGHVSRRWHCMKAKKFDSDFDAGKDVPSELDPTKARRIKQEPKRVNVDFPIWMIEELDKEAKRLGVTRQSIIKVWLAERLERSHTKEPS